MKTKLFFSDLCPDTPAFVNRLETLGIEHESINITESMGNLKQFLRVRDSRTEFQAAKEAGSIGIPVLEYGDLLIFNPDQLEELTK